MSENQSTSPLGLIVLSSVLPVICIVAIVLRFWLRRKQDSLVKVDDWIMLPAAILFVGMCICAIMGIQRRVWGYATPYAEENTNPQAFNDDSICYQLLEAFQFIQIPTLGCIKLGAILFYRRIFCVHGNRTVFDIATLLFIGIIVLWIVAMTVMNGLQCGSDISALWGDQYDAKCIYVFPFEIGFAISNFLLDLSIILLPLPKIWSLHISVSRKLAITGVFGLALIGLAASIARMVTYIKIEANGLNFIADFRLEDTESVFWSNLEAGLSLLAVNLPSLWTIAKTTCSKRILTSLGSLKSLIFLRSSHTSHASQSHTRLRDDTTAASPEDSAAGFASQRAEYELYTVPATESKENILHPLNNQSVTKWDGAQIDEMI